MNLEEIYTKAIDVAVDAANDCPEVAHDPGYWATRNMIKAAITAYEKAMFGTNLPENVSIIYAEKVTPEIAAEIERRWVACKPLPDGVKVMIVDRTSFSETLE